MNKVIPFHSLTAHRSPTITAHTGSDQCLQCPNTTHCWPAVGSGIAEFRFARRRVKRGATLYRMGEQFHSLYSVRSGTFKTRTLLEDGRDQVTGFHLTGELLGFDGIESAHYHTDCIALEDSEVCVIPYEQVLHMSRSQPARMLTLLSAMSREIVREQALMALLGRMQADERVATFLLSLSDRMKARGFSPTCFILRMTREEIGSHLGLKLETVSRIFSRLHAQGHIQVVGNRQITIVDPRALKNSSALAKESSGGTPAERSRVKAVPRARTRAPGIRLATAPSTLDRAATAISR